MGSVVGLIQPRGDSDGRTPLGSGHSGNLRFSYVTSPPSIHLPFFNFGSLDTVRLAAPRSGTDVPFRHGARAEDRFACPKEARRVAPGQRRCRNRLAAASAPARQRATRGHHVDGLWSHGIKNRSTLVAVHNVRDRLRTFHIRRLFAHITLLSRQSLTTHMRRYAGDNGPV